MRMAKDTYFTVVTIINVQIIRLKRPRITGAEGLPPESASTVFKV